MGNNAPAVLGVFAVVCAGIVVSPEYYLPWASKNESVPPPSQMPVTLLEGEFTLDRGTPTMRVPVPCVNPRRECEITARATSGECEASLQLAEARFSKDLDYLTQKWKVIPADVSPVSLYLRLKPGTESATVSIKVQQRLTPEDQLQTETR